MLIAGGTIEKPVHEDITYENIYKSQDNLWNFLFFIGYLKAVERNFMEQQIYLSMKIPNDEILYVYKNHVREWFTQCVERQDLTGLIKAFENGGCEEAAEIITTQLMETISFYDYREYYYHGFLAGLLKNSRGYVIKSNRESGPGRYDLVLKTRRILKGKAIILELKVADNVHRLEEGCMEALNQIEDKHYENDILEEGYPGVLKYGICFYKKECMVMTN